ncbi:MAG: hypothetical protein EKK37_00435 [Sphingobacteriales bacterium]|nr:MAG: hypothetical protein EKK37_00435 [Sphingobacteriales bacterium]
MKRIYLFLLLILSCRLNAQELYAFTEPASNMPAKAIGIYGSERVLKDLHSLKTTNRTTLGLEYGINKQLMIHGYTTFSDMYLTSYRWESIRAYAKYRFLSKDEVHKHFRAAAFGKLAYSKNIWVYDEVDLDGDQSGWQLGLVATQLLHKLAVSASGSINRVLYFEKEKSLRPPVKNAFDYSLSAGYLLLPQEYKDYKQTNLNIYCELLGQKSLDDNKYYVDIAPAIQLIFNSATKVNIGTRFEIKGNMHRMARPYRTYMISIEHTILNAVK